MVCCTESQVAALAQHLAHSCRDEVDRKIEADRQVRQAEEKAKADILQAERDRLAQWRETVPGQVCSGEEDCDKLSRSHCQQVKRGTVERNCHRSGLVQWAETCHRQMRRDCHRHRGSAFHRRHQWGDTVTGQAEAQQGETVIGAAQRNCQR